MDVRVFAAGHGDCVLLSTDRGHILVDGGMPNSYKNHWADYVGKLRDNGEDIDLVCISHIDRDHIGGILSMLNNEKDWRLHARRQQLPQDLRPDREGPDTPRPPKIDMIWHNSFFDVVRKKYFKDPLISEVNSLEVAEVLFRGSAVMAGAANEPFSISANSDEPLMKTGAELSGRLNFLGQSVAEAIDVSRRIHVDQLDIPLNPQFGGGFVLQRTRKRFRVASMTIRVLGPTKAELDNLIETWKKYLVRYASHLARKAKGHNKIDGHLSQNSVEDILEKAKSSAIEFASNQIVTPPNLASIVMHVIHRGKSILLTGDADDVSILDGLKKTGLIENGRPFEVDILKVPHHGADNSYSHDFARQVIAEHYVFCSDGDNTNPEIAVMQGYLDNLLGNTGKNINGVLSSRGKIKFWFNYSPERAKNDKAKIKKHWKNIEKFLAKAVQDHGARFEFEYLETGDFFIIE